MNKLEHTILSPDTGYMGGRYEVRREESPTRFISHLAEVSGMRTIEELEHDGNSKPKFSSLVKRAGIIGGIIVGSCGNPRSTPKDIDVVVCVDGEYSRYMHEYMEEMKMEFDRSFFQRYEFDGTKKSPFTVVNGRLDMLGGISIISPPDLNIVAAIYRTENPIAISHTIEAAQEIQTVLDVIAGMKTK